MMRSAIPSATYRLQLHKGFTLDDAVKLVPYFQRLGISHLYLSPIMTARAGSIHGYDVVDHRQVNPELGGEPALLRLAAACHARLMGLIVDIVPNHMAIGGADNALWLDVLENGASSLYAGAFDIDFETGPEGSTGKLLVPLLGEPYGEALEGGKLSVVADLALGKLVVAYGPHRFPLRREEYTLLTGGLPLAQADLAAWQAPDKLHALLERQHFRLAWWRGSGDVVNWRRFFDVNELAALRIEDETVFQIVHTLTFRLYAEGVIDGVRVDHIDGLADPARYARRLREKLVSLNGARPAGAPQDGPYLIVEKILGHGETLVADWGVDGTTGYDFMDQVSALQHDPAGEAVLDDLWRDISARTVVFDEEETTARTEILEGGFAGQFAVCAQSFCRLAQADLATRDLTEEGFRRALGALVARLRIYRTYATGRRDAPALDPSFVASFDAARESLPGESLWFDFIAAALRGEGPGSDDDRANTLRRLNQLTAPVAAKAVEDTAFYRYGRLLSRNDVGFDAGLLSTDADKFVQSGQARARDWPRAMLTTATHDHKRGEDVRARLAVLSELPELWRDTVRNWFDLTAAARPPEIAADDAYMLFQTLVGAWPLELNATDADGLGAFAERVAGWREKSLREAKLRSSWAAPDAAYEAASRDWLQCLLDPARSAAFLHSLSEFVARVAGAGAVNGVVQAALRCAWPGVPDLYQGAELWDFSLVDPDNRRPVDFARREALLNGGCEDWLDGSVKLAVIAKLLTWRRADPALFGSGAVEALAVRGARRAHVLAFQRRADEHALLMAVMLHAAGPVVTLGAPAPASWWADTEVRLGAQWVSAASLFAAGPVFARLAPHAVEGEGSEALRVYA
jgi:(1->4)-alpha-D-glucan 1-alpha-D-glucosylmutase